MKSLVIAPFRHDHHAQDLERLDAFFESDSMFTASTDGDRLEVALTRSGTPHKRQFQLLLDQETLNDAYVALVDGAVRGVIDVRFEAWNSRLIINHFYVDAPYRRQGIGRRLMECAMELGRSYGAGILWVETTNVNYPAVLAYRRLGFDLCGFDATFYEGTSAAGEFALFMSRRLD
ncbi:MAG: GNAT family N-acetyltransferase [Candidatus Hydrogenedentes bacterium]|nr:GNAT family N-acetyltransferase [Candidatus Hydrogenedentota bacterium]